MEELFLFESDYSLDAPRSIEQLEQLRPVSPEAKPLDFLPQFARREASVFSLDGIDRAQWQWGGYNAAIGSLPAWKALLEKRRVEALLAVAAKRRDWEKQVERGEVPLCGWWE